MLATAHAPWQPQGRPAFAARPRRVEPQPPRHHAVGAPGNARGRLAAVLALLALLLPTPVRAVADWLSADERRWLAAHPVLRVAADPDFAPYTYFDERGLLRGVAADLLAQVAPMLGVRLVPVPLADWPAVVDAVRSRRVDLVAALVRSPARESYLAFTADYLETPLGVFTRSDHPRLRGIDELSRARLALVREHAASERVRQRLPGASVVWSNGVDEALRRVAAGEADAYVGVLGVAQHRIQQQRLTQLGPQFRFEAGHHGQAIGVRRDWAPLAAILDKALARIDPVERAAILARWLPGSGPRLASRPEWTAAERRWLDAARALRVGVQGDLAPYSSASPEHGAQGLVVDAARLLAARLGLAVEFVVADSEARLGEWLRERRIDVMPTAGATSASDVQGQPAGVIYDSSLLLLCGERGACLSRLEAGDAMRVGVQRGSPAHDFVTRRPQLHAVPQPTLGGAIARLEQGRVDAVLGEARRLLATLEASGDARERLRVVGMPVGGDLRLQLLARDDRPEMAGALASALRSLGDGELSELRSRWMSGPGADEGPRLRGQLRRVLQLGGTVSAAVLAVLLWMVWWNRRLRREVGLRRAAEAAAASAREQAERASLHKSEFVANTSHELRTPLNAIVGTQHLLDATPLDEHQRGLLQIQRRATDGLLGLVDDLLDLARIEAGHLALRDEPFDPRALFEETLALMEVPAQAKGLAVRLRVEPGPLPPVLRGDPRRLRQVLVNLLGNAVKYTGQGEVCLHAGVSAASGAGRVRLVCAVADTGPGVAPTARQRIFEPYQQGNGSAAESSSGVGLGLAIAGEVVAAMGGRLQLDSAPGRGSRFHFALELALGDPAERPVAADDAGPDATPASTDGPGTLQPVAPQRVLLVEDNEVNQLIAEEVLRARGCTVTSVGSGEAALLQLQRLPLPELVLLDVGLPGIDGLEVVKRLRAGGGEAATLPVIGLTARALLHERDACLRAGMDAVVLKPFDPERLWETMCRAAARLPPGN